MTAWMFMIPGSDWHYQTHVRHATVGETRVPNVMRRPAYDTAPLRGDVRPPGYCGVPDWAGLWYQPAGQGAAVSAATGCFERGMENRAHPGT